MLQYATVPGPIVVGEDSSSSRRMLIESGRSLIIRITMANAGELRHCAQDYGVALTGNAYNDLKLTAEMISTTIRARMTPRKWLERIFPIQ